MDGMTKKAWIALGAVVIFLSALILLKAGYSYVENKNHGGLHISRMKVANLNVDGIDVSHHNGRIDWPTVAKDERIKFVYIKATQGVGFTDPMFHHNFRHASNTRLKVGVYHFFSNSTSGEQQFKHFKSVVGSDVGDIIPMVDVEYAGDWQKSDAKLQKELLAFCSQIKRVYGRKPIIYTNAGLYNRHLAGKFDSYYIWIGNYGYRPIIRGKSKYNLWQYSEKGMVKGIDGHVDLNCFVNGMTLDKLVI